MIPPDLDIPATVAFYVKSATLMSVRLTMPRGAIQPRRERLMYRDDDDKECRSSRNERIQR
jgi:hypothetical protein